MCANCITLILKNICSLKSFYLAKKYQLFSLLIYSQTKIFICYVMQAAIAYFLKLKILHQQGFQYFYKGDKHKHCFFPFLITITECLWAEKKLSVRSVIFIGFCHTEQPFNSN